MPVTIANAEIAGWLESDLEGRLEVMEDDGNREEPDYIDADSVAQALRDIKTFPAILTLSDAEEQQCAIALENLLDFLDVADLEEHKADIESALAQIGGVRGGSRFIHGTTDELGNPIPALGDYPGITERWTAGLDQDGKPVENSVFDYFRTKLGQDPHDKTLRGLPADSGCGADCVHAIDSAWSLRLEASPQQWESLIGLVNHTIEVYWHG